MAALFGNSTALSLSAPWHSDLFSNCFSPRRSVSLCRISPIFCAARSCKPVLSCSAGNGGGAGRSSNGRGGGGGGLNGERGDQSDNEDDERVSLKEKLMAVTGAAIILFLLWPANFLRLRMAVDARAFVKVALPGTSYSLFEGVGSTLVCMEVTDATTNAKKILADEAVDKSSSEEVGTVLTDALTIAKKAVDKSAAEEVENVPVLSSSIACAVNVAVSRNLHFSDGLNMLMSSSRSMSNSSGRIGKCSRRWDTV